MHKYKLIEDLIILDKIILTKDSIVEFKDTEEFLVESAIGQVKLTKEILKNKIRPIEQNLDFKISILNEDDEDVENLFRMQLDIKSTRRKLRKIEEEFRRILSENL